MQLVLDSICLNSWRLNTLSKQLLWTRYEQPVISQPHCSSQVPKKVSVLFNYCYFNLILRFILSFPIFVATRSFRSTRVLCWMSSLGEALNFAENFRDILCSPKFSFLVLWNILTYECRGIFRVNLNEWDGVFCRNCWWLLIIDYFGEKALSWMFDWVLNAPLEYF